MDALLGKFTRAQKGVKSTGEAFLQLSDRVEDDLIATWTSEEQEALRKGGDSLKIYEVKIKKGAFGPSVWRAESNICSANW